MQVSGNSEKRLQDFIAGEIAKSKAEIEPQIPFSSEEYGDRLAKLKTGMREQGLTTVLLSSPESQCWLHGYSLRWYKAHSPLRWKPLITTVVSLEHDHPVLFEGLEHEEMIRRTSVVQDVRLLPRYKRDDFLDFMVGEMAAEGWLSGSVGLELSSYLPYPRVHQELSNALEHKGAVIEDASQLIRSVRRVKSPQEIAMIERAAQINDAALLHLDEVLQPGMTELEAWSEMIRAMAAQGGEPAALHELAAVGPDAGHAISGRRALQRGDTLLVDPCGVFNRYHSNRTGIFYLGTPPDEYFILMEKIAGAFPILEATAKAGTPISEVNRALRDYYTEQGLWGLKDQTWIGGYELGISFPPDWVGEWTFTVADEDPEGVFEAGMVTNFESIFFLPLIDTLVYEKQGARTLSRIPYKIHTIDC